MTVAQSPGWQNPRILLTLLVIFLCGMSAGMVVMSVAHRVNRPSMQITWKDANSKEVSLARLRKELDLTPAQAEQLESILDDFFTYYHTLQAQLDDVRGSGKQRILRILDDRQKKKFEQLLSQMQDKPLH